MKPHFPRPRWRRTGPRLALPLVLVAARPAQSGAQRLLPPLPKVDPLSDGIFVRSVDLPPVEASDRGEGDVDEGGASKSRRRLIVYDFRPALPPYTAKSLDEIMLFPEESASTGEGGGAEEEGEERASEGVKGQQDEQGGEQVVCAEYSNDVSGDAERRESLQNEIDADTAEDASPTDEEDATENDKSVLETPIPVEQVDAANDPPSEHLAPTTAAAATTSTSDEGSEIKETDVQLSDVDRTPLEIELVALTKDPEEEKVEKTATEVESSTVVGNNDHESKLETFIEDERVASGEEEESEDAESPTDGAAFADDSDTHGGTDAPKEGDRKEGSESIDPPSEAIDPPSEEQAIREETSQDESDEATEEEPTNPDNAELAQSSRVESESLDEPASVGSEDDGVSDADAVPAVSAGDAAGGVDSAPMENEREDAIRSDTTTTTTGFDSKPVDNARKEEGGDGPPPKDDAIVSDSESPDAPASPETIADDGGDSPKERITVRYDDAVLSFEPSTASNNRDANREFVAGLDEIDKLFESVDVPDELDVGADGSSMQDVLVGQGLKILWKRLGNLGRGVKGGFDDAAGKVRGALSPLTGLLGDNEEEEEDVTFDSLIKSLNGDGASSVVFDKKNENAKEEGVQMKRKDGRSNKSKKEKKGREEKEKKHGNLQLLQSQKAQRIWKFARRKWEQAKLLLDDLLHIFEGEEDEDDDADGNFGLGDMKLPKGLPKGVGTFKGGGEMPNFDGKFGSEVDESFLKSRYEAMMKLQQQQKKEEEK